MTLGELWEAGKPGNAVFKNTEKFVMLEKEEDSIRGNLVRGIQTVYNYYVHTDSCGWSATHNKIKKTDHYNTGKIEVIDFIKDQSLSFCLGNVIKYVCRAEHKGEKEQDLKKAIEYLNLELKND